VLDALRVSVVAGSKKPVEEGSWGADFYCGAEVEWTPLEELEDLRVQLEQFFEDGGTVPPHRELTIEVSRKGDTTLFQWDHDSRDKLTAKAPQWHPTRFSVSDEIREAFERQHGALFPQVLDELRPGDGVDLEAMGGVAFKRAENRRVLWFSRAKIE